LGSKSCALKSKEYEMATARDANTNDQVSRAADAGRESLNAAAEGSQRLADQVAEMFSFSQGRGEELTRQSRQNLEALTQAGTVLTRGFQDLSREWFGLVQESLRRNAEAVSAFARCRSLPDLVAVQTDFVRDSLQQTLEGTRRIAEVSTRVANEASQTVAAQTAGSRRAA
jgi:phasin family protein